MPKFAKIALSLIDEPANPIRFEMNEKKFTSLCDSMRDIGLLSPVGLKVSGDRYEVEYGHRRLLAARHLRWKELPALIYKHEELAEGAAMLAENHEREDVTAAEEAALFAQAQEQFKLDEAGLMQRFRKSANYIAERLALLRNDLAIFNAVKDRKINFSVAKELNKCSDESHRRYLLDAAINSGSSARVIAGWVAQWRAQPVASSTPTDATPLEPVPQTEPDHGIRCQFCGGDRDPYNLVSIYVHKWELEQIEKILQRTPDESDNRTSLEVAGSNA